MQIFTSVLIVSVLLGAILGAPSPNDSPLISATYPRHRRASSSFASRKRTSTSASSRPRGNPYPQPPQTTGNNGTGFPVSGYIESTAANPNYWIVDHYHDNIVCLLAAFSGTVRVRPSNSSFRGGTFHVAPEVSLGRRAHCERHSRHIFWKFSQNEQKSLEDDDGEDAASDDGDSDEDQSSAQLSPNGSTTVRPILRRPLTPRLIPIEISERQLSVGFHIIGSLIEFHVAYIECLQKAEKYVGTQRYRVHSDSICVNLSVSFDLGSFGDRAAFECTHIWGKTLKDVHYLRDRRFYAGEAQISLEFIRIDRDPILSPTIGGYAFRKARRRCLADSLLSWQSFAITGSLIAIFIIGFFALCVCSNSSCSDDLSPGSYSGDTGNCSCWACVTTLGRKLCFCFNRNRRSSTRRGHGRRGELLNRSTYERNLLDRSAQSEQNHVQQHDSHHQCPNHHTHHHHSTMGGSGAGPHQRHYHGNHRHIRRPAPPPLLPPPPPPPPPSSSSTGTTHVDSELLVLPVGHTSECQVLLEMLDDDDNDIDDCSDWNSVDTERLVIVQSVQPHLHTPTTFSLSSSSGVSFSQTPVCSSTPTRSGSIFSQNKLTIATIDHTPNSSCTDDAMFHYFCAWFVLCATLASQHARSRLRIRCVSQHYHKPHHFQPIPPSSPPEVERQRRTSPQSTSGGLALSSSRMRAHNGSTDRVRGLQ